jgi:ParB/RepB/Spo0J family partition protein
MKDPRRSPPTSTESETLRVPLSQNKESDRLRLRKPPYDGIEDLAEKIKRDGQSTAMFVRQLKSGEFELIFGYRRKAALELIGENTALVRVFALDDREAYFLAISENQDRHSMSDIERAEACIRLHQEGENQEQIAKRMGWTSTKTVSRYMAVATEAPAVLKDALQKRQVTMALAAVFFEKAIQLPSAKQSEALAVAAVHEMSAAEFARYLIRLRGEKAKSPAHAEPIRNLKNGGFILRIRVDATDPSAAHEAIITLKTALRRAHAITKKHASKPTTEASEVTMRAPDRTSMSGTSPTTAFGLRWSLEQKNGPPNGRAQTPQSPAMSGRGRSSAEVIDRDALDDVSDSDTPLVIDARSGRVTAC